MQIGNNMRNRLLDMIKTDPAVSSISVVPALVFVMNKFEIILFCEIISFDRGGTRIEDPLMISFVIANFVR